VTKEEKEWRETFTNSVRNCGFVTQFIHANGAVRTCSGRRGSSTTGGKGATPPGEEEIEYRGRLNVGFRAEDILENLTFRSTIEYPMMGVISHWIAPYTYFDVHLRK